MSRQPVLLLVEDEPRVRAALENTLRELGYEVQVAETGEETLNRLADVAPDIVLSDVRMPGMGGIELLRLIRKRAPSVDVILMTAYEDMPTVAQAMRDGAFDFLVKPLKRDDLQAVLHRAVADRRVRDPNRADDGKAADEGGLDALVGTSPEMIEVFKRVGRLAANRVTALIRGETGTGKGRVARAIHSNSRAADEPFVAVNCTALPETLLESELFGHVEGAFTGAVSDRRGRFNLAGRGTIFLDEVGDTSPALQAKLLKVIEEREYSPVGAEYAVESEARVLAATHRDLESLVDSGHFREDLYYRLRVVEVNLPPLRDRSDDIPLLARHFVRSACAELGQSPPVISESALAALVEHSWPGNVRELENCVRRAVVLTTGGVLRPGDLGLEPTASRAGGRLSTLDEVEARHVRRALAFTDGNRTQAADVLGISKPRLYRMLDKYAIE